MKPKKIQVAFYTKGYGDNGAVQALVIIGRKRYIVKAVYLYCGAWTKQRKKNPVFVIECIGFAYLDGANSTISIRRKTANNRSRGSLL